MAMGIVKYAQHTLGSDTGLLHISEAMGTPVTMILGPTSKETGARVTLSDSRVIENKDILAYHTNVSPQLLDINICQINTTNADFASLQIKQAHQ